MSIRMTIELPDGDSVQTVVQALEAYKVRLRAGSVPDMLTWVLDRKREFIAIHEESKDDIMHHD